MDSWWDTNGI
ncbi:hypothetical protein AZE42_06631, partial [Rhizopogon vesiculosus]